MSYVPDYCLLDTGIRSASRYEVVSNLHHSSRSSADSCYRPSGQDPGNSQTMQRYRSEYDRHQDFLVNGPGGTRAPTSTARHDRPQPNSIPYGISDQQRS